MSIFAQFAQAGYYDYNYDYGTNGTMDSTATLFVVGIAFLFVLIITVIAYVIHAFLLGRIFKKAGVEQWIAWVPFYNTWKMLELGGQPGFWSILTVVPIVNIVSMVFLYISMYHIGLKLQKEGWFVLLAIFLPIVWLIWLAFDESKWQSGVVALETKQKEVKAAGKTVPKNKNS